MVFTTESLYSVSEIEEISPKKRRDFFLPFRLIDGVKAFTHKKILYPTQKLPIEIEKRTGEFKVKSFILIQSIISFVNKVIVTPCKPNKILIFWSAAFIQLWILFRVSSRIEVL